MAEERKKRWRPSLTAYRELEDVIHRQCQELDAWREKYRELAGGKSVVPKSEYDLLVKRYHKLSEENGSLSDDNKAYEASNRHMEEELKRLREENGELSRRLTDSEDEIELLKGRGFWARVFNL